MVYIRQFLLAIVLTIAASSIIPLRGEAQCAMCTLNAENSTKEGNMQGKGLNDGILFLLAMPFIIGAGIGVLWYKKYRVKPQRKFL